jgi:hypothetical protein
MRIYLAGPYRNRDIVAQEANIRRGRQAAAGLIAAGHDVECPWIDRELLQADDEGELSVADLQRNSMSKLERWAEAICLMPGWEDSAGTHGELCAAARMGLSVLWWLHDYVMLPTSTDFCSVIEEYNNAGEGQRAQELEDAAVAEAVDMAQVEELRAESEATRQGCYGKACVHYALASKYKRERDLARVAAKEISKVNDMLIARKRDLEAKIKTLHVK